MIFFIGLPRYSQVTVVPEKFVVQAATVEQPHLPFMQTSLSSRPLQSASDTHSHVSVSVLHFETPGPEQWPSFEHPQRPVVESQTVPP
jgi:hypothetical protein